MANGVLFGLLALISLLVPVSAVALNANVVPADDGNGGAPIDPDERLGEIQDRIGDPDAGDAPAPPGNAIDDGLMNIGEGVGDVLAENWAVTGIITVGLFACAVVGFFLSSRFVDPRVALRNPQRSMLYGFVKGNPGVHLKQLSGEFRMKTSTVLWHVRKLEAADLVRSKKANGYRVFYPVSGGMEARQLSEAVTALSNENARRIFDAVFHQRGTQQRTLSVHLGINPGTVRWHLKKMCEASLLEEVGQGRSHSYFTTELGERALRQVSGMSQAVETRIPAATPAAQVVLEEPVIFG